MTDIKHMTTETVPQALRAFFARHPKIAVAFSGGSDSAYLLYAAKQCGADIGVYYVKSQFQAEFEYADALRLARQLGCGVKTIDLNVLADESIAANPENRCYYCKKRIFTAIIAAAEADGYDTVIDGTNASDDASDRPGMRALKELGVLSPLRECGITKADMRLYSQKAGLFTWDKPAYACLATRVAHGMNITEALLAKVEKVENALCELGFSDFRVRIGRDASAKLQIHKSQMELLVQKREDVMGALENDFDDILLDLHLRGE